MNSYEFLKNELKAFNFSLCAKNGLNSGTRKK